MLVRVHREERGASLAEVLVAIAIVSIVGLALLYGISTSFQASQMAQINVTAESLARSALEDIRLMPYAPDHKYTLPADYSNYADYTLPTVVTAVKITKVPDTSPYTESVTVTVTYNPRQISKVDLEQGIISFTAPGKQVISMTTYMTKEYVAP